MQLGVYQHYKGSKYEVLDTVRHSESEELLVLYRTLYADKNLWVRPYDMFFENVTIDSKVIPRFKYVGDTHE